MESIESTGVPRYDDRPSSALQRAATLASTEVEVPLDALELSVVMPCLNEADTIATCIRKAHAALATHGIRGEIVIADNGSVDGSRDIAAALGARVVPVAEPGYGSALRGGIAAARGRYVIMGDADDSYDFGEIPRFVERLREGNDLVQGCRLASGGGTILPGAMPVLHKWWGNPMFSAMARRWFRAPIHDVYCGLRGFRRELVTQLDQRCTGMEFATEMIIKASLHGVRIAEVPITLHPDGRTSHPPHLKTFRDGWRTLRFFLLYSPRWLFVVPGLVALMLGVVGYAIALPGVTWQGVRFDVHTLLFASLALMVGYQSVLFSLLAKTFAVHARLLPTGERWNRISSLLSLERGLGAGFASFVAGLALLGAAVAQWWETGFGDLDYSTTMRWVIPGAMLAALGFETVLASFFLSLLRLRRD